MPENPSEIRPTWTPSREREDFYRAARFWREASVTDNLQACISRFPEAPAIRDAHRELTFAELWDGAARVAGWLVEQGLQPGEAVTFQLPNWHEAALVFHGILMAGGVAVPVTPILRQREVGFILAQTGARFAFLAREFRRFDYAAMCAQAAEGTHLRHVVWVRGDAGAPQDTVLGEVLAHEPISDQDAAARRRRGLDAATVIYTSGTTSEPKGAIHTHDGLLASTRMCQELFSLNENDVLFNPSPATHITGISLTFLFPATFGCRVTLQDVWNPQEAFEAIRRDRTTFLLFSTPFLAALVEQAETSDVSLDHIRTIVCGGADVPESLARRAGERLGDVVRMYGATEAPNASCGSPWDPQPKKWGTEGRWLFPTEGRVVDPETGADCAPGVVGEAWWRAPQMCAGYLKSELNDASYTSDGYFRTGDLVTMDESGYVTVVGRLKEIINRGGEKLSAREIEELILESDAVAEAAVTPMADPVLGERVCAWVVLRPGAGLTLADLTDHLLQFGLAKQKLPERLEILDQLPRTPSGKVRRVELREQVDARLATAAPA